MERPSSRRTFIATSAVALAGAAGCLGALSTNSDDSTDDPAHSDGEDRKGDETDDEADETESEETPDPPEGGAVVFVYDDGPMEDYTKAFPVHQEFDAPATVGVVSDWIGREDYQDSGCMGVDQLDELVAAGWEVASHTVDHTAVGTFELTEDAHAGDERVAVEEFRHGYHEGLTLEITDGEHPSHRTVVGYGTDDGQYIELDEPLDEAYPAGETVVRYPEAQITDAMGESKRALEELGFEIDTFLAPYDNFDDYSREFAEEYYAGVANARHGERINDPEGFDPYETRRDYFIEYTSREAVKADLDTIAEHGALGVMGAHTFKEEVSEERIRETLEWVDERGITVLTLREAIARYAAD